MGKCVSGITITYSTLVWTPLAKKVQVIQIFCQTIVLVKSNIPCFPITRQRVVDQTQTVSTWPQAGKCYVHIKHAKSVAVPLSLYVYYQRSAETGRGEVLEPLTAKSDEAAAITIITPQRPDVLQPQCYIPLHFFCGLKKRNTIQINKMDY